VAFALGYVLRIGLEAWIRVAKFLRDVLDDVPAIKLPLDGALAIKQEIENKLIASMEANRPELSALH